MMAEIKELLLNPYVMVFLTVSVIAFAAVIIALLYFFRHRLDELHIGREGVRARMTNKSTQYDRTVERIDSYTKKAIRKGIAPLELLDTSKYGTHVEILLVNLAAIQPLIYAAHENHHTRELSDNGADGYISEKTNEVWDAVQKYRFDVPEVNRERVESFVMHALKTVLVPSVRRSCNEKLAYYQSMVDSNGTSECDKTAYRRLIAKNNKYLQDLDKLDNRSDIITKSSVFGKEKPA